MFYLCGEDGDGTKYRVPFSSNSNFKLRLNAIKADPDRNYPNMISGKTEPWKLPAYIKSFLEEHGIAYQRIGQGGESIEQKKTYRLEIRTDDRMPEEMGGVLTQVNGWHIITINGNDKPVEQMASFLHEACHLWRGDLERSDGVTAAQIEEACESDLIEACKWILKEHERKQREGE